MRIALRIGFLALAIGWLGGCDANAPADDRLLVIEGYLEAGRPLPPITVHSARPLDAPANTADAYALDDVELQLELDGRQVAYVPTGVAGRYAPADDTTRLDAYTAFRLLAGWQDLVVSAIGTVPPPVVLDSVYLRIPSGPVDAILIDSLRLDTLGVGAQKGFLYPVEVTLWWLAEAPAAQALWFEAQLRPRIAFSSPVVDFFLQPVEIKRETEMAIQPGGSLKWTGIYGIPVDDRTSAFPDHALTVYLVRSFEDYARFAATRGAPQRREPEGNLDGAAGILAGIALDSLVCDVTGPAERRSCRP
jgi:hypothetical protein